MTNVPDQTVDVPRYCARIGYAGALTPTFGTLASLIEHHIAAIPFENIDVLLERGIDISAAAVDAKLLGRHRGGYCFEQNMLFRRVLRALGFEVEQHAGRVLWDSKPGAPARPRTHMALSVNIDDEWWLVDIGFGGCVPSAPLQLAQTAPQPTPHEAFRVVPLGATVRIEVQLHDAWRALYELSLEPLLAVDYEPANWFTSTHPDSIFRKDLMVARTTRDARFVLANQRLTIHRRTGAVEQHTLDAKQLESVLSDTFGLVAKPCWKPLLERVAASV